MRSSQHPLFRENRLVFLNENFGNKSEVNTQESENPKKKQEEVKNSKELLKTIEDFPSDKNIKPGEERYEALFQFAVKNIEDLYRQLGPDVNSQTHEMHAKYYEVAEGKWEWLITLSPRDGRRDEGSVACSISLNEKGNIIESSLFRCDSKSGALKKCLSIKESEEEMQKMQERTDVHLAEYKLDHALLQEAFTELPNKLPGNVVEAANIEVKLEKMLSKLSAIMNGMDIAGRHESEAHNAFQEEIQKELVAVNHYQDSSVPSKSELPSQSKKERIFLLNAKVWVTEDTKNLLNLAKKKGVVLLGGPELNKIFATNPDSDVTSLIQEGQENRIFVDGGRLHILAKIGGRMEYMGHVRANGVINGDERHIAFLEKYLRESIKYVDAEALKNK